MKENVVFEREGNLQPFVAKKGLLGLMVNISGVLMKMRK
jgi:hypothetical protein